MVVDFHTHILPKVDDGSSSVEVSIEMLREEHRQGVKTVVLTPHFYANHDAPERFLKRRKRSLDKLCEAMSAETELPELRVGAEVHYFDGMSDCEYLEDFVIEGTRCVLIEMPSRRWDERLLAEVGSVYPKRRLMPVIAHVDRYLPLLNAEKVFDRLASMPVMVQVNADFFLSFSTKRLALKMLSEEKIHFLGSDCHGINKRKPNLGLAIEVIRGRLGEKPIEFINSNEKRINL